VNTSPNPETRSIRIDYDLPQSPSKVWRALTDPALLATWLMANDLRAVVGHRFTFKADPLPGWDGTVHCEVLEVDVEKRLRYSWRGGAGAMAIDTTVTWTLAPTASGGTRLSLEQAGFSPTNTFAFDGLTRGWAGKVQARMREVLASLD
jgi:uncharacterized protein YndB with AHSA1/START domain